MRALSFLMQRREGYVKHKVSELVDREGDAFFFHKAQTYILGEDGAWRKPTLWDRIKMLRQRLFWWRVEKIMVIEANPETGVITTVGLTWSWRKWKWVAP